MTQPTAQHVCDVAPAGGSHGVRSPDIDNTILL
jgi:hypothetical protein